MNTVAFKKKVKSSAVSKKRQRKDDTDASEDEDDVVRAQSKSNARGIDISAAKLSNKESLLDVTYSGDRSASNSNVNDATREIADIDGHNEASLLGRRSHHKTPGDQSNQSVKSTAKEQGAKRGQTGPIKAPTNIRAISVIDYQPDVCKDYKQTGFCGFGDTCKFLHDRGDFKQGWQLDRDWEDVGKSKKAHDGIKSGTDDAADESNIPFKCIICKDDYKSPIITKCGHYFCERCALERFKKTPACAQCGSGTGGLFSGAKKLRQLLDEKQKRIDQKALEEDRATQES